MLLAGGFGLLGGRPGPSPIGTWATNTSGASPLTAIQPTAEGLEPAVTPRVSCAPDPVDPPEVELRVDGAVYANRDGGEVLASGSLPIAVPRDAITEVRVDGAACAHAWQIEVNGADIERRTGGSPASQNAFQLLLPDSGGSDPDRLRVRLLFSTFAVDAAWLVQVDRFEAPLGELAPSQDRPAVAAWYGCDLAIRLGNGYSAGPDACGGSGIGPLPQLAPLPVRPSEALVFRIRDWQLSEASIACGHLAPDPAAQESSIFSPDPACAVGWDADGEIVRLDGPSQPGTWAIAVSGCATEGDNSVCGTWYGELDVAA